MWWWAGFIGKRTGVSNRVDYYSVVIEFRRCFDQFQHRRTVNRHSTVTHYQRPNMTHSQEGGTGGEVSEILFFSAKSKRRPSLIYSMQIIPVCLSIVARRKGVSATRRGGLNWTPISLLVGHPCKLFHTVGLSSPVLAVLIYSAKCFQDRSVVCGRYWPG